MKKLIVTIMSFFLLGGLILSAPASEAMLEQGVEALKTGNYSSAELIFRRLADSDDNEIKDRAWFYLAQAIFYQKNYRSSIHEFTSYLNKCKTMTLCQESRYWLGESYYYIKEYNNAIEEYKRYIDKNKNERLASFAHDRIGAIYYEQKRYDEAIMEWEKAINQSSDQNANAMRILNIGKTLHLNNKYDEALNRLSPLLNSTADPKITAAARIISGRIYQASGNHARAIAIFNAIPESLLQAAPYSEARYYKSLSLINRGETLNARAQLQIYLAIAKDEPLRYNALYELGLLNMRTGEAERGLGQLNDARKTDDPDLKLIINRYLGNYYMDKDPALSASYLEDSVGTSADDARDIKLSLAKVYISEKKLNEAEKILTAYQENYPYDRNIDQAKFLMARIYLERGDNEKAMAFLDFIKQNNPFSEYINEADLYIATAHYNSGDYLKAINLLNSYLKKNGIENKYGAIKLTAESYIAMNNLNMAKTYVNTIISGYINNAGAIDVVSQFAMVSVEKGQNAAWYTNLVLEKFPDSEPALKLCLFLGDNDFKAGRYQNAAAYYDKYLKGNRRELKGSAFYNKAISLYNIKKYTDVIAMLKSGSIPPMDEEQWTNIPFLLARCYNETGTPDKIYAMFSEQDIKNMPEDILFVFLKTAVQLGDINIAVRSFDLVKTNRKNASEISYAIASYYKAVPDDEQAIKYYTMVINEYPETEKADFAKYEYAKILFNGKQEANAILQLKEIKNKSLDEDKNALLILCCFMTGDNKSAAELTLREINRLAKKESYEQILNLNLSYYYNIKNTAMFNRFAYYLQTVSKDSAVYVNYMCGKYYFEAKDYASAFAYFSKIADAENQYSAETWFRLGEISILVNKKPQQAAQYFNQVIEKDRESDYGYRARIELALIYHENAREEEALSMLKEIMGAQKKRTYAIQAENIYNAFQNEIKQN